jgi:hypothetical protein
MIIAIDGHFIVILAKQESDDLIENVLSRFIDFSTHTCTMVKIVFVKTFSNFVMNKEMILSK